MSQRAWKTRMDLFGSLHVYDENGSRLTNDRMSADEEWPEYAALISTAPDLLGVCKAFIADLDAATNNENHQINLCIHETRFRAAIEKATDYE